MPSEIKNEISHRGKALKALKEFFEEGEEPEHKKARNLNEETWFLSNLFHYTVSVMYIWLVYCGIKKFPSFYEKVSLSQCYSLQTFEQEMFRQEGNSLP